MKRGHLLALPTLQLELGAAPRAGSHLQLGKEDLSWAHWRVVGKPQRGKRLLSNARKEGIGVWSRHQEPSRLGNDPSKVW